MAGRSGENRSDAELLAAHVTGDRYAFEALFHRHHRHLYRLARLTTASREDAADALQEAMLSAHRTAASFRHDAAVGSWLHRIVVNACMDRVRRDRHVLRRAGDLAEIDLASDRDDHASTEAVLDVRAALATLPEAQRMALVLVDMHGLPIAEAAAVLQVAEGTVKSRCFRGRAALALILRERAGESVGTIDAGRASKTRTPSAPDPTVNLAPEGTP